jgi:hypothetical protein
VLVGPDGKIVARTSQLDRAVDVIRQALVQSGAWQPVAAAPGVKVTVERVPRDQATAKPPYRLVPAPAHDDLARDATFSLVDGGLHAPTLDQLNNGRGPSNEDVPRDAIFFNGHQPEGRVAADLGRVAPVGAIHTHSWHKDFRAPQVYVVYGSDGTAPGFDPAPKAGTDPTMCGWTKIAAVDTYPPTEPPGGRYAVAITSDPPGQAIGRWRYLLFAVFVTSTQDNTGYTFYSEIDVFEHKGATP